MRLDFFFKHVFVNSDVETVIIFQSRYTFLVEKGKMSEVTLCEQNMRKLVVLSGSEEAPQVQKPEQVVYETPDEVFEEQKITHTQTPNENIDTAASDFTDNYRKMRKLTFPSGIISHHLITRRHQSKRHNQRHAAHRL